MKKKTINLEVGSTVQQVEAFVLGNLAIHHGQRDWRQQPWRTDFLVTHVPTSTVLCSCRLQRTARSIVVALTIIGDLVDQSFGLEEGSYKAQNKLKRLLEDHGADPHGGTDYKD